MWNWIINSKEWILSGIGIFILSGAFWVIKTLFKKHFTKYCWAPSVPIKNGVSTKPIFEYPKNLSFDLKKGDFAGGYVGGEESFTQSLQKFVLTERNKYQIYSDNYGIEEAVTIFSVKNREEFSRQCENIAHRIMEWDKEWIQEIYKIYRKGNALIIEMKVNGKPETLKCLVPNIHKKVGDHHKAKI